MLKQAAVRKASVPGGAERASFTGFTGVKVSRLRQANQPGVTLLFSALGREDAASPRRTVERHELYGASNAREPQGFVLSPSYGEQL